MKLMIMAYKKAINRIIVVAPKDYWTGGVEALHLLADHIRRVSSLIVEIAYFDADQYRSRGGGLENAFSKPSLPLDGYQKYRVNIHDTTSKQDYSSTFFILPEVYPFLLQYLAHNRSLVWWLSVDFYYKMMGSHLRNFLRFFFNRKFYIPYPFMLQRCHHLFQSKYAATSFMVLSNKQDLLGFKIMTSPLRSVFITKNDHSKVLKKHLISYNPAKGKAEYKLIESILRRYNAVPIEAMSAEEVSTVLKSSLIFLDLGEHPGRDRLPREAVSNGCVVVVAKRGSASFAEDMPLDEFYKIDVSDANWTINLEAILDTITANPSFHQSRMTYYRRYVEGELKRFERNVVDLIAFIQNT